MKHRAPSARRQAGAALLALVAVAVLAFAYMIVSHMNATTRFRDLQVGHNAKVLNQAKQALIGFVAQQAAIGDDPTTSPTVEGRNPGSLPCPEAPGYFGTDNEGIAAPACAVPAVGRLPWRTLGLDRLTDAAGEPLWYAISPGWHLPNTSASTIINSNSVGQLNVDGVPNDAVALLIAPGPAITTQTSPGCTARSQSHPQSAGSLNRLDYLECENAAGAAFVTNRSSGDFNDQALRITVADIMPAIEAAIAVRIEREIAPQLRSVYASNTWGTNVSAANPMYPFPGQFADPNLAASYGGSAGACDALNNVCEGLLPAIFSNAPGSTTTPCTVADGPLCDPTFVRWTAAGSSVRVTSFTLGVTLPIIGTLNIANIAPNTTFLLGLLGWTPPPGGTACTVNMTNSPHTLDCPVMVPGLVGALSTNINYEITGAVSNVAMAMRQFDPNANIGFTPTVPPTIALNASGSATITLRGNVPTTSALLNLDTSLCGLNILGLLPVAGGCIPQNVSVPMTLLPDHPLLDASNPATGWFMRNRWYEVLYYAAARSATAAALPAAPGCTTGTNCLSVGNLATPSDNKRALIVLAGRSRIGTAGASRALTDFLDTAENRTANRVFEKLHVNATSNDRFVVVQSN